MGDILNMHLLCNHCTLLAIYCLDHYYCCACRYANRAKNIQNSAHINEDPKDAMLREFQKEIEELRKMLDEGTSVAVEFALTSSLFPVQPVEVKEVEERVGRRTEREELVRSTGDESKSEVIAIKLCCMRR